MAEEIIRSNLEKIYNKPLNQEEINSMVAGFTDFFELLMEIDKKTKKGGQANENS